MATPTSHHDDQYADHDTHSREHPMNSTRADRGPQTTSPGTGVPREEMPESRPLTKKDRRLLVWAWSIPVLVATQFAMLAVIPVLVVLRRSWRKRRLRPMRAWAAALAVTYATPLVLWATLPDRQGSLSKDMHPVLGVAVMAVAVAYAVRLHLLRAERGRR